MIQRWNKNIPIGAGAALGLATACTSTSESDSASAFFSAGRNQFSELKVASIVTTHFWASVWLSFWSWAVLVLVWAPVSSSRVQGRRPHWSRTPS